MSDFLDSAGLLGLCIAMLDPITFEVILVLIIICVIGFLVKTVWYVAERLVHGRHKGSKWRYVLSAYWKLEAAPSRFRPFRIRLWYRILALATSVQTNIANTIGRVKRFFHSGGNPRTLLPLAHNSNWNTVRLCASEPLTVKNERYDFWHQAVRLHEMNVKGDVTQAEDKESAGHFCQCSQSPEGLRLKVIKTQAHVRAIR